MSTPDINAIKRSFYDELQTQAKSTVYKELNINRAYAVDSSAIGDFPWFWENAGIFNLHTFKWLFSVFQYNADGYLQTAGDDLDTDLFNTYMAISAQLDSSDEATVNKAMLAAQSQLNTLISDWVALAGPIPAANSGTPLAKFSYVAGQILSWGAGGR